MKLDRKRPKGDLINITPLIDVVFILLVFFMLAGTIEPKGAFAIDPTTSDSDMRGDIRDFVVLVDENGDVAIDEERIARDTLTERIRTELTTNPAALIQLKPDSHAEASDVIDIMEDIREAGAEYIVLLTVSGGDV